MINIKEYYTNPVYNQATQDKFASVNLNANALAVSTVLSHNTSMNAVELSADVDKLNNLLQLEDLPADYNKVSDHIQNQYDLYDPIMPYIPRSGKISAALNVPIYLGAETLAVIPAASNLITSIIGFGTELVMTTPEDEERDLLIHMKEHSPELHDNYNNYRFELRQLKRLQQNMNRKDTTDVSLFINIADEYDLEYIIKYEIANFNDLQNAIKDYEERSDEVLFNYATVVGRHKLAQYIKDGSYAGVIQNLKDINIFLAESTDYIQSATDVDLRSSIPFMTIGAGVDLALVLTGMGVGKAIVNRGIKSKTAGHTKYRQLTDKRNKHYTEVNAGIKGVFNRLWGKERKSRLNKIKNNEMTWEQMTGAAIFSSPRIFNEGFSNAIADGYTVEEAREIGLSYAAIATVTEIIGAKLILQSGRFFTHPSIDYQRAGMKLGAADKNNLLRTIATVTSRLSAAGLSEGLTELAQDIEYDVIANMIGEDYNFMEAFLESEMGLLIQHYTTDDVDLSEERIQNNFISFLVGALAGAGIRGTLDIAGTNAGQQHIGGAVNNHIPITDTQRNVYKQVFQKTYNQLHTNREKSVADKILDNRPLTQAEQQIIDDSKALRQMVQAVNPTAFGLESNQTANIIPEQDMGIVTTDFTKLSEMVAAASNNVDTIATIIQNTEVPFNMVSIVPGNRMLMGDLDAVADINIQNKSITLNADKINNLPALSKILKNPNIKNNINTIAALENAVINQFSNNVALSAEKSIPENVISNILKSNNKDNINKLADIYKPLSPKSTNKEIINFLNEVYSSSGLSTEQNIQILADINSSISISLSVLHSSNIISLNNVANIQSIAVQTKLLKDAGMTNSQIAKLESLMGNDLYKHLQKSLKNKYTNVNVDSDPFITEDSDIPAIINSLNDIVDSGTTISDIVLGEYNINNIYNNSTPSVQSALSNAIYKIRETLNAFQNLNNEADVLSVANNNGANIKDISDIPSGITNIMKSSLQDVKNEMTPSSYKHLTSKIEDISTTGYQNMSPTVARAMKTIYNSTGRNILTTLFGADLANMARQLFNIKSPDGTVNKMKLFFILTTGASGFSALLFGLLRSAANDAYQSALSGEIKTNSLQKTSTRGINRIANIFGNKVKSNKINSKYRTGPYSFTPDINGVTYDIIKDKIKNINYE